MAENKTEPKESKVRFQLWMSKETQALADEMWKADNCSCKGEFIEKAIIFYCGFLNSKSHEDYFSNIVVSTITSILKESDNRHNRNLYKLAVEVSVLANMIASLKNVSELEMTRIRELCEKEVRKLNGALYAEEAIRWQSS